MKKVSCDLLVIGAGSGGVAAAIRASQHGAKCIVANYVRPSPHGTSWGIGGTCVNVGCIPKKLMHIAAMKAEELSALEHFGFQSQRKNVFSWSVLQENVTNYIRSLNFKTNAAFSNANIEILNAFASFPSEKRLDKSSGQEIFTNVLCENFDNKERWDIAAKNVIIATGGRPRIPDIPGAKEYGITSDDIFWSTKDPGDMVIIGAGYIAFECAGFFGRFAALLGRRKPIMLVRSKALRGFDDDAVKQVVESMKEVVDIHYDEPIAVEKVSGGDKPLTVKTRKGVSLSVDNVIFAVGRRAETKSLRLASVGVEIAEKSGKIILNSNGETSCKGVFALGDIVENSAELTPMAIYEGRALADSLFAAKTQPQPIAKCRPFTYDPNLIPTTIFTPIEYGRVGYTEKSAIEYFGKEVIKVYHTAVQTLENAFLMQFPECKPQKCFLKVVTIMDNQNDVSSANERIIGWHLVAPNAGEITQGVALAMLKGVTMQDVESLLGIHPTTAECIQSLKNKSTVPVAELPGC